VDKRRTAPLTKAVRRALRLLLGALSGESFLQLIALFMKP
jgi:hypothetical protein